MQKKTWSKPILTVARVSDAKLGGNPNAVDQIFPATNGILAAS